MASSRTLAVLVRPPYSHEIYRATYKSHFQSGHKQVEPPMALMQIGAALVASGVEVRVVDGEVEDLPLDILIQRITDMQPDLVGVTSTTPEFQNARFIAERVKKKRPEVVTVIGGAHATHVPWDVAERTEGIDHVVVYEGEKAMVAIANGNKCQIREYSANARMLLAKAGIDDPAKYGSIILLGPHQSTHDLDRVRPLRTSPYIDMSPYRYADPQIGLVHTDSVETARGCPFGCMFCSSARSGLRLRTVDSVLDELGLIHDAFRRNGLHGFVVFLDDTLTISRGRSVELFERIIKCNFHMHYKVFTRADTIATSSGSKADLEFARLLKRAGVTTLSLGVETGDESINRAMNKGVSLDDYRHACEILDQVDFPEKRGSFIIGHPYETESSIIRSINFAKELRLHRIGVNIMTPYPGTSVYEAARKGEGLYFENAASSLSERKRK